MQRKSFQAKFQRDIVTDIGRGFFRSTGFFKAQLQIIATESYFFENIRHSVVRICSEFLLALISRQDI